MPKTTPMQIVFVTKKPLVWSADEAWDVNSLGFEAEFTNKSDMRMDAIEASIDDSDFSEQLPMADAFLIKRMRRQDRPGRKVSGYDERIGLMLKRSAYDCAWLCHKTLPPPAWVYKPTKVSEETVSAGDWDWMSESVASGYDSM